MKIQIHHHQHILMNQIMMQINHFIKKIKKKYQHFVNVLEIYYLFYNYMKNGKYGNNNNFNNKNKTKIKMMIIIMYIFMY